MICTVEVRHTKGLHLHTCANINTSCALACVALDSNKVHGKRGVQSNCAPAGVAAAEGDVSAAGGTSKWSHSPLQQRDRVRRSAVSCYCPPHPHQSSIRYIYLRMSAAETKDPGGTYLFANTSQSASRLW